MDRKIVIDPFLLQRPAAGEWTGAVESIVHWLGAESAQNRLVLSGACADSLLQEDLCPYLNPYALQAILASERQIAFSAIDLNKCATRALAQCTLDCEDVLWEEYSLEPVALSERLASSMLRSLFPAVILYCHLRWGEIGAASRPGGGIDSEVEALMSAAEVLSTVAQDRSKVEFRFPVLFRPPLQEPDPTDVLTDPVGVIAAFYPSVIYPSEQIVSPLRPFTVGSGFVESLERLGLHGKPQVLRIVIKQAIRVIAQQESKYPKMNVHPQRVGPGANDAQEEREDGAKGFRATITTEGAGYRLVYWKKNSASGPTYELREVRTESE